MNYGLTQDKLDPRDIWLDELLAGQEEDIVPLTDKFRTEDIPFENQGSTVFCCAFAAAKLVQIFVYLNTGARIVLSKMDLFFNGGGTKKGAGFKQMLEQLRTVGCHSNGKMPMPEDPYSINLSKDFEKLKKEAAMLPTERPYKIDGYARIVPTEDELEKARKKYGAVLVGVYAKGGWFSDLTKRKGTPDNHAVIYVGKEKGICRWIHDSITNLKIFDGYHRLSPDYNFLSAFVITGVTDQARQEIYAKRLEEYPVCVSRYGKPQNYLAEVQAENEMLDTFKKNNNPSLMVYAMRHKKQLINARAYGDYNFQYTKWGIWHAGDLINFEYAKMKGLKLPFNLDEVKK